ncbi:hypothetical protein D3C83_44740 [compost metagenome]
MVAIGARVLEAQRGTRGPAGEYAFLATVTGALCLNDPVHALGLLEAGIGDWLRRDEHKAELAYLFNLANSRVRRPGTAACPAPAAG